MPIENSQAVESEDLDISTSDGDESCPIDSLKASDLFDEESDLPAIQQAAPPTTSESISCQVWDSSGPENNVGAKGSDDRAACRVDKNAEIDECGVAVKGNACQGRSTPNDITDDFCCDWTTKRDGSRNSCVCNTKVIGPTLDENICTTCMLIAEASTETDDWCRKMVLCTMRERKSWKGDNNQCVTNARKTGNGTWFTPDKCTCDHTAPNPSKNKNQQYCNCKAAIMAGKDYPLYRLYSQIPPQCPQESPNFYNLPNCGNPCDKGGSEITPPNGVSCKHKFFRCKVPS